jgi:hypothetical protein
MISLTYISLKVIRLIQTRAKIVSGLQSHLQVIAYTIKSIIQVDFWSKKKYLVTRFLPNLYLLVNNSRTVRTRSVTSANDVPSSRSAMALRTSPITRRSPQVSSSGQPQGS